MNDVEATGVWLAAIESGYVREPVWRAWADARIHENPGTPPIWLVDLSEAASAKEATPALVRACANTDDPWALRIGFRYLRHLRGHCSHDEAVREIEHEEDIVEFVESRFLGRRSASRTDEVFAPLARRAAERWASLNASDSTFI